MKMISVYGINLNWLLVGKGQPFIEVGTQEVNDNIRVKIPAGDPVEQLLLEEEERAGITLTPEQRRAFMKILRELVSRDVRSLRELLRAIPKGQHHEQE